MKIKMLSAGLTRLSLLALAAWAWSPTARAQVPSMVSYQGRVLVAGTNFTGNGQFKFALVQGAGPTLLWKNDGSAGNTEPAAAVSIPVTNGLVNTLLGDTTLANMIALPAGIFFSNSDVRLRVWFDGGLGSQQLSPDTRIVSVGYAMLASTVPNASITAAKLAAGVLNPTNFPANSVSSGQLADSIELGTNNVSGRLDVFRTAAGTPAITLDGSASAISTFGSDGQEQIRLHGISYGELLLRNSLVNNATAVNLTAQGSTGGRLTLNNTNGSSRAILEGENTGGLLTLYTSDGNTGAILYGNEGAGSGALSLRNTNGASRLRAYGGPISGSLELFDTNGTRTIFMEGAENGGTTGGQLVMYQSDGSATIQLDAEVGTGGGGYFSLYEGDGTEALVAQAEGGGNIIFRNTNGATRAFITGGGTQGGEVRVYEQDGTLTTLIHNVSDAGVVSVRNSAGVETGYLWGRNNAGQTGGQFGLKNSAGVETITMNGDLSGEGHIVTEVLTITGGADLSESFDINAAKGELLPGMIVSIDPKNPGELELSKSAYDKKVAGVVSGAGGVKPGMLMRQSGTKADGKHPVALTGRVYCWIDADAGGAIEPGDLITTSSTPGHGMKATDSNRSSGAVIGKAMTAVEKGKGLALVLVNLQ